MKIKRVEIDNCFNLKNSKLDLKDGRTLIVGPNGSGKTNIIKCITFIVKQLTACSAETDRVKLEKPENKYNDEESTIKLHFDLSSEEILTVLKMRLWCVLSNCCTLLEQTKHEQDSSDKMSKKVEKFLAKVLPELYETCMEKENDVHNSGTALTIEWTRNSDQVLIELGETTLPDFRSKEKKVIKNEENDWWEGFNFKIQSGKDPVTKNPSEALDHILDHKKFLKIERQSSTETWFPVGVTPSELPRQGRHVIKYLKQLQEVREEIFGDKEFSLDTLVAHFLQTSVCIVSQSRGSLPTECGSLFWDIAKVEEKLVNAKLSNVLNVAFSSESTDANGPRKSRDAEQLKKLKSAMLRISGLEFKVAEGETPFGDVEITTTQRPALSRWSKSESGCSRKKSSHLCVMLKKSHAGDNSWEPLLRCSRGERELLMILSAYYLSGSDNVILDEPGQSFHPPQQAQLRRLLERKEDDKVLLAITHSLEMISPQWIPNLYHMHQNGHSYTASLVKYTPSNNGEMVTVLDRTMTDMLMAAEMRRIFFSSGVIFVEGINDQRVLKVLREVKLEEVNENQGATATQSNVDRCDIIPMNGCHNWLKSYVAASRLGIPFVVVLDGDILKLKQKGNRQVSILQERLDLTEDMPDELLTLKNELAKTNHPSEVRNILQTYRHLWIWEHRDIEETLLLLKDDSVTNKIQADDDVMCELVALHLLPDPKGPVNIQPLPEPELNRSQAPPAEDHEQSTSSSATNDSHVKMFENMVEKPINELFEKAKEKLNGTKESISHARETEIGDTFKDLGNLIKSKMTQLPRQYDKGIKSNTTQNKIDWMNVAYQLHDGKWKFLSWKTLKTIVKLAIEVPDHPFNELWEYLTKNDSSVTQVIPEHTTEDLS